MKIISRHIRSAALPLIVAATSAITVLPATALAEAEIFATDGIALKGHDVVGYFTESKPVPGSADYTAEHMGATFQFASAENRDMFVANPDKYTPQYGGYCAFGTTFQKKVDGDPQAWEIVDGKLYINSSQDIETRWSTDISGNVMKADKIWMDIKAADPATL